MSQETPTTIHGLKQKSFFKLPSFHPTKTYRKYNKRAFLGENNKALFIQTGAHSLIKTPTSPLKIKTPKYGDSTAEQVTFLKYKTKDEIISSTYCKFAERVLLIELNSRHRTYNLIVLDDALKHISSVKLIKGTFALSVIAYEAQSSILIVYNDFIESFSFSYGNKFLISNMSHESQGQNQRIESADTSLNESGLSRATTFGNSSGISGYSNSPYYFENINRPGMLILDHHETLVDIKLQPHLAKLWLCYHYKVVIYNLLTREIEKIFDMSVLTHKTQIHNLLLFSPMFCDKEKTLFVTSDLSGSMKIWSYHTNQDEPAGSLKMEGLLLSKSGTEFIDIELFNLQKEIPLILSQSETSLTLWDTISNEAISEISLQEPILPYPAKFPNQSCLLSDVDGIFLFYLDNEDLFGTFVEFDKVIDTLAIIESNTSKMASVYSEILNISRTIINQDDRNVYILETSPVCQCVNMVSNCDENLVGGDSNQSQNSRKLFTKLNSIKHSINWEILMTIDDASTIKIYDTSKYQENLLATHFIENTTTGILYEHIIELDYAIAYHQDRLNGDTEEAKKALSKPYCDSTNQIFGILGNDKGQISVINILTGRVQTSSKALENENYKIDEISISNRTIRDYQNMPFLSAFCKTSTKILLFKLYATVEECLVPQSQLELNFPPKLVEFCSYDQLAISITDTKNFSNIITFYDVRSNKRLDHKPEYDHIQEVSDVCSCPSLNIILTASLDGVITVWDSSSNGKFLARLVTNKKILEICIVATTGDIVFKSKANVLRKGGNDGSCVRTILLVFWGC